MMPTEKADAVPRLAEHRLPTRPVMNSGPPCSGSHRDWKIIRDFTKIYGLKKASASLGWLSKGHKTSEVHVRFKLCKHCAVY